MRRRDFLSGIVGSATSWPLAAHAQQQELMRHIGVLMLYPESDSEGQLRATAFREGLAKLGWVGGRNVQIDFKSPDVIIANGTPAAKIMQQSSRTVPVHLHRWQRPGRGWVGAESR